MRRIRQPVRVLHLVNDLGYGGAQKMILNLAKGIDKKSFVPIVGFWGSHFGSEMTDQFLGSGIKVVDFRAKRKFDLLSFWRLIKYLSINTIAILHTHLFFMHVVGRIAGRCAGTRRIISTQHNLRKSNHPLLRLMESITSPLSNITTYVSKATQRTYCQNSSNFSADAFFFGKKHFTIYNAVDIDEIKYAKNHYDIVQTCRSLCLEKTDYVFVCVGRLHPSKGHKYLIEAAGYLKKTHPNFRLLIVGDGALRNELMQQTSEWDLTGHIQFLGYRDDIYRILAACNALIQPSIFEGFGLASAEAMACGLPVISTNLPSIAEVVSHEETGILVPPADSGALSRTMAQLMDHPEMAETYGANGKRRVERLFSNKVITEQYETLYKALIR